MAISDSRPVPIYNMPFRAYFGIYTTAGAMQSGATITATRVIQDGTDGAANGTVTEVGTTGVYYLDLLDSEMDTSCTVIKVVATGCVPVVLPLYPETTGDIRVDVTSISNNPTAAVNAYRAFSNMKVGTVASGSTSTNIRSDLNAEATADQYKGRPIYFLTGILAGQVVEVTGYSQTNGAFTVSVTPTGEPPGAGDLFLLA